MYESPTLEEQCLALIDARRIKCRSFDELGVAQRGADSVLREVLDLADETGQVTESALAAVETRQQSAWRAADPHTFLLGAVDAPHRIGFVGVGPALTVKVVSPPESDAVSVSVERDRRKEEVLKRILPLSGSDEAVLAGVAGLFEPGKRHDSVDWLVKRSRVAPIEEVSGWRNEGVGDGHHNRYNIEARESGVPAGQCHSMRSRGG